MQDLFELLKEAEGKDPRLIELSENGTEKNKVSFYSNTGAGSNICDFSLEDIPNRSTDNIAFRYLDIYASNIKVGVPSIWFRSADDYMEYLRESGELNRLYLAIYNVLKGDMFIIKSLIDKFGGFDKLYFKSRNPGALADEFGVKSIGVSMLGIVGEVKEMICNFTGCVEFLMEFRDMLNTSNKNEQMDKLRRLLGSRRAMITDGRYFVVDKDSVFCGENNGQKSTIISNNTLNMMPNAEAVPKIPLLTFEIVDMNRSVISAKEPWGEKGVVRAMDGLRVAINNLRSIIREKGE